MLECGEHSLRLQRTRAELRQNADKPWNLEWNLEMKPLPAFEDAESKKLIHALCQEHQVDIPLLKDLCDVMQGHAGAGRRNDVDSEIAACIDRFLIRRPNM